MSDHHDLVRSPEQIAFDLAKALQFTLPDLRSARKGILPVSCVTVLIPKIVRPLAKSAACLIVPVCLYGYLASHARQTSFTDGVSYIFNGLFHLQDLAEDIGWFKTISLLVSCLKAAGFAFYFAMKVPLDACFDIIGKRVRIAEGRVMVREEDKELGKRGEVTHYHFDMKERSFQVNRKAFLALDNGGSYRVYYLARSLTLVAIEPSALAREADVKAQAAASPTTAEGAI